MLGSGALLAEAQADARMASTASNATVRNETLFISLSSITL
jgi:hypothetical protein